MIWFLSMGLALHGVPGWQLRHVLAWDIEQLMWRAGSRPSRWDGHRPVGARQPSAFRHEQNDLAVRFADYVGDIAEDAVIVILDGNANEIANRTFCGKQAFIRSSGVRSSASGACWPCVRAPLLVRRRNRGLPTLAYLQNSGETR
jgi:hypothetical protein